MKRTVELGTIDYRAVVRKYVDENKPMRVVAEEVGCSYSTVNRILHRLEVPIRAHGWPPRKAKKEGS